jgi:hypothetical protein
MGGGCENPRAADWGGLGAEERKREKGEVGGGRTRREERLCRCGRELKLTRLE